MLLGSSGSPFHAVLVGSNDIPAAISLMDRTHQSPRLTTILHPRKTQMDPTFAERKATIRQLYLERS